MVTRMWLCESAIRSPHATPLKPPNTSEWMTPRRAQASMETGNSGTIGRWKVPVDAVVTGVQPAADEPLPERWVAGVQGGVPVGVPGEEVRVLLEALGKALLAEPFEDRRVGRVRLGDELPRRVVVLLLTPVNRDLSRGDLRFLLFCHCSTSSEDDGDGVDEREPALPFSEQPCAYAEGAQGCSEPTNAWRVKAPVSPCVSEFQQRSSVSFSARTTTEPSAGSGSVS